MALVGKSKNCDRNNFCQSFFFAGGVLECIECNKSGKDNTYKKTWPQRIYCAYPRASLSAQSKKVGGTTLQKIDRKQMLVMDSGLTQNSNFSFHSVIMG